MPHGTVTFNETRCKGCELCVSACPKGLIALDMQHYNAAGYHPAALVDPLDKCTGCALCAVACPDAAISVFRFAAAAV